MKVGGREWMEVCVCVEEGEGWGVLIHGKKKKKKTGHHTLIAKLTTKDNIFK